MVTERLLSITGEDALDVDRKFREAVTVELDTRIVVATSELPRLADASGALSGRLLILSLRQSFYDREDHGLTDRLLAELPGILMWSLDGLRRLRKRGRFVQPARGAELQEELDDLASPVGAFVKEACTVEPGASVRCDQLFGRWRTWCVENGRDHVGTIQNFGRDLRAADVGVSTVKSRTGGSRVRFYEVVLLEGCNV